jgi:hypothetical protein
LVSSHARSDLYFFGGKEVNAAADAVISQANVILGKIMLWELHHPQNGPSPDQDEILAFLRKIENLLLGLDPARDSFIKAEKKDLGLP